MFRYLRQQSVRISVPGMTWRLITLRRVTSFRSGTETIKDFLVPRQIPSTIHCGGMNLPRLYFRLVIIVSPNSSPVRPTNGIYCSVKVLKKSSNFRFKIVLSEISKSPAIVWDSTSLHQKCKYKINVFSGILLLCFLASFQE